MKLYHFTRRESVAGIFRRGLLPARGLTPAHSPGDTSIMNGVVYLTALSGRDEQIWCPNADVLAECARITIEIPDSDKRLSRWLPYLRKRGAAGRRLLANLHRDYVGADIDHHYVYRGVVSPHFFREVA